MNQTKIESFIEAVVNTLVGFAITLIALPIVNYALDIKMSGAQMSLSTLLFTIISVVRGFIIRRFFNNLSYIKTKLKNLILSKWTMF